MSRGQPGSASEHLQRLFADGSLTGLSDGRLLERYLAYRDGWPSQPWWSPRGHGPGGLPRSLADPGDLDDAFQATFLVLARRSRAVRQRSPRKLALRRVAAASVCWRTAPRGEEARATGGRGAGGQGGDGHRSRRTRGFDLRGDRAAPLGLSPASRSLPPARKDPGGGRRRTCAGPRAWSVAGWRGPGAAPDPADPPGCGAGSSTRGPQPTPEGLAAGAVRGD